MNCHFATLAAFVSFVIPAAGSPAQEFAEPTSINPALIFSGNQSPFLEDIDSDGLSDVLVISDSSLYWLRAVAPGQFAEPVALFTTVGSPRSGSFEDIDGDGDRDFVNRENGAIVMYERTSSGLSQTATTLVNANSLILESLLGDVDGDGDIDVVYEDFLMLIFGDVGLFVARNDGAGQFTAPELLTSIAAPDFLRLRSLTDIDNDGAADILLNPGSSDFVVLRSLGAAGFAPSAELTPNAGEAYSPQLADVTGDGIADIVVALGLHPGSVSILPGLGGGSYGAPNPLPFGQPVSSLRTIDLDSDGIVDIVARGADDTSWFRGIGFGAFGSAATVGEAGQADGQNPIALGDVDGDGDIDMVADLVLEHGRRGLGWMAGQPSGATPRLGEPMQLGGAIQAGMVTAFGDVDGDGQLELMGMHRYGEITPIAVEIVAPGMAGGQPTPTFSRTLLADLGRTDASQLTLGDIDDDQFADAIVVADGQLVVALSAGGLQLNVPFDLGPVDPGVRPELEDIDGDGDLDIVAASASANEIVWFQNSGAGSFAAPLSFETTQDPASHIRFADLDGDGLRDLVVAQREAAGPGRVSWFTNLGGSFGTAQRLDAGGATDATALAVADLDGNGLLDVAWGSESNNQVRWARATGPGTFASQAPLLTIGNFAEEIAVTDIDLDGDQDLVILLRNSIRYALNGGGATFASSTQLDIQPDSLSVGDFDMDGDEDLISSIGSGLLRWRENLATGDVGEMTCGPAITNSSGASAMMSAQGSASVSANDLQLTASDLPQDVFGYFLTSEISAITFPIMGSVGRLCLSGSIGRYVGLGEIQFSGPAGQLELDIDLQMIPTPSGPVAAQPGTTRYFQAWFRDSTPAGSATSNFTNALGVTFQ